MTTVSTGAPTPSAIGASDQDLAPGQEVGEYVVDRAIGRGGFGTVYGALHPVIGKRVAIKVLARKFSSDPEVVSRFAAEARAVNQIRHRNIIDIFSFGQLSDGRHYYVMEYLDGEGLDTYLKERGPLPLADALPILRAIARALDAAHGKGIAHRDLKPENIFLAHDPDGDVFPKLLDFGIAKLLAPEDDVRHRTGTGVPLGTPYYMSPEQCRGREVDHRTDIYSFGIVAYRVLTGTFPFEGDDFVELLFKQVNEEAPLPSSRNPALTPQVDDAISWMMQKDRAKRPPTVVEGVNALDPNAVVTPGLSRGSRPSVPPLARYTPRTLSADALAATVTPDTLPTDALATPRVKSRAGLFTLLGLGVVALAATAYFIFAVNHDKPAPKAAEPTVDVVTPKAVVPETPVADAAVEESVEEPKAAASTVDAGVIEAAPTPKKPKRPRPVTTTGEESEQGDMIKLDSSAFKKGRQ